ncbi:MAG: Hsp20/alpha crystallin family protein [Firmicutes bacterium]|nr:Hsp20/alpha crystallin family protein [Bacillota bacterium]
MYRLMPFRRHGRESYFPQTFQQLFSWPEFSWQGFNVDVKETADGYSLQADLPGVAKENIKLSINDGYLTVAVRQDEIKAEDKDNYICRERRQVSSQRSFYVGNISPDDVTASYRDGVLDVRFPKAADGPSNLDIPIQ